MFYTSLLQLHRYEYDTGKALQALVKAPALRTIDKKWNEEDTVSTLYKYCMVVLYREII